MQPSDKPKNAIVATAAFLPELSPDCRLLPPALEALGWKVELKVWDDPTVDWRAADVVIIRSIWDYFEKRGAFEAWLDLLDASGVSVENPTRVLRHNLDKRYLGELERAGARIVPTIYTDKHAGTRDRVADLGWSDVVIKPTVNGAGRNTHRVAATDQTAFHVALTETLRDGEVMVQKFLPTILNDGEWSLIFFDGAYSHAVRKTSKPGEFRVQDDWGGTVHFDEPDLDTIDQARGVLAAARDVLGCTTPFTYARVDGVVTPEGDFLLMELELIEPELFLRAHPEAPERCARAIAGRLPNRA